MDLDIRYDAVPAADAWEQQLAVVDDDTGWDHAYLTAVRERRGTLDDVDDADLRDQADIVGLPDEPEPAAGSVEVPQRFEVWAQ